MPEVVSHPKGDATKVVFEPGEVTYDLSANHLSEELQRMPTPTLLAVYNATTKKNVKGFHNRAKGIAQTYAALTKAAAPLPVPASTPTEDTTMPNTKKTARKAPAKKTPKTNGVARGRPLMFGLEAKITVLAKENPKRTGSDAHARFAKYKTGMTIGEALKAGVLPEDLRWDVGHKLISVK